MVNKISEVYKDEPRPEYAPKKKSVNKPPAASPPTVATIQRGILPISLILFNIKKRFVNRITYFEQVILVKEIT